jgi:hypothetical protein
MAATVKQDAWPLTVVASMMVAVALVTAAFGLHTVVRPDMDPTSSYKTMWSLTVPAEVLALLYRRRSVLYQQQRRVIESRRSALRTSSWATVVGGLLTAAAILVSRVS